MANHPEWGSSSICLTTSFTLGPVSISAHSLTRVGRIRIHRWILQYVSRFPLSVTINSHNNLRDSTPICLNASSCFFWDRILGMTLVPEGHVWNHGIGLTQIWSPTLSYAMTLDAALRGGRTQTCCILNCKYIYPTCSLKAVLIVLIKQGRYFTVFVSRTGSIWHALEQVKHEISEELAMVKSAEIMAVVITYTWLFSLSFAYSPFIAHPSTPQRPNGDSI